ncbi:MAG: polynucleotide adenylyltransferase, partial [Lachnospiraceae bacterium]|nr:polynucleotide adenylyltransferase [Lachnospiraceae bacterium]
RVDGVYKDMRHPEAVTFTSSLEEDLLRRDFTINAMAYNDEEGLIDEYNGLKDIDNKTIRCVGDPMDRFTEDALRMLRAVRFSAQLGYDIEPDTAEAIKNLHSRLDMISAERIQVELSKLILSHNPDYLRIAYELGITSVILPEFDKCMEQQQHHIHHCYSVGEHILHSMMNIEADRVLRYTMLFHDMAKPECLTTDPDGTEHFHGHDIVSAEMSHVIMKRLKFDNDTLHGVELLVRNHDLKVEETHKAVRRAMNKIGKEQFMQLLKVKHADVLAQSDYMREEKLNHLNRLKVIYNEIMEAGHGTQVNELGITGSDLIELGMNPGPSIGDVLKELLELVLEDPDKNNREVLIDEAKKILQRIE